MIDTPLQPRRGIQPEVEEIVARSERLSISPAPKPPLVVSEPPFDTELNLRCRRRKVNMAFRVGRGRGGGERGQPVANAEVMEVVQQMQARLDALTTCRNIDDGDVTEPEVEVAEEEAVAVTPEMRFF